MRLQRSISRRMNGKAYIKNQVVISNHDIVKLGWNQGDELETRITSKRSLLIYKVEPKPHVKKLSYEEFRDAIISLLRCIPDGCTWSDLKVRADLKQLTPSPIWVRRMEDERRLERVLDPITSKVFWKYVDRSKLNGWVSKNQN